MKAGIMLSSIMALAAGRAWADCGLQGDIDAARLPKSPPAYAGEVLKASREHLPGQGRQVQIRAGLNIAMIGGQHYLLASRSNAGWRVERWVQGSARMSPDGGTPAAKVTRGRLSRSQGAKLDVMLGVACLWRFPPYLPNTLPLKGGQNVTCMDGANLVIEIRSIRRRWVGAQECQIQGAPGDIYNLLSQAQGL
ncbi:MAG: hypothetical protein CFE28_07145 [Alphaproteobacteria bacterium PA2]|nr:MAG: hypothetical protein CFE28_07145 [Alphaproteobacteria bacterium PA2]